MRSQSSVREAIEASFLTENRKNRLKIVNLKNRLIMFTHDEKFDFDDYSLNEKNFCRIRVFSNEFNS